MADVVDFEAEVIEASRRRPVLVDFWAPWCGPCKMLGPVLDKMAGEAAGRWTLTKVNTDEQSDLAQRFGIRGIPNLKLFRDGAVIAELAGALPENQLRQWLDEHLPTPKRDVMARARELLRCGQASAAVDLLRPLADTDPGDAELAALCARAEVFSRPATALERVAEIPAQSAWAEAAALVRDLADALLSAPAATTRLPATSLRERYVAGLASLRGEDFDAALTALINVLLERPTYDEGRAKRACAAIMKHLGPRHRIAEQHSRRYAMAVHV